MGGKQKTVQTNTASAQQWTDDFLLLLHQTLFIDVANSIQPVDSIICFYFILLLTLKHVQLR